MTVLEDNMTKVKMSGVSTNSPIQLQSMVVEGSGFVLVYQLHVPRIVMNFAVYQNIRVKCEPREEI